MPKYKELERIRLLNSMIDGSSIKDVIESLEFVCAKKADLALDHGDRRAHELFDSVAYTLKNVMSIVINGGKP